MVPTTLSNGESASLMPRTIVSEDRAIYRTISEGT